MDIEEIEGRVRRWVSAAYARESRKSLHEIARALVSSLESRDDGSDRNGDRDIYDTGFALSSSSESRASNLSFDSECDGSDGDGGKRFDWEGVRGV